jgi:hypothetical protein
VDDCDLQPVALSTPQSGSLSGPGFNQPLDPLSGGRYRVRPRLAGERAVPQQLNVPRFGRLEEAERCARQQAEGSDRPLVVEKLAPAGCWLELFTVESMLVA